MQHELQPDSLVDLKFIMADTGFGKTFIYDRIKSGDLQEGMANEFRDLLVEKFKDSKVETFIGTFTA